MANRFLWSRRFLNPARKTATRTRSVPRNGHAASDVATVLFILLLHAALEGAKATLAPPLLAAARSARDGCRKFRAVLRGSG